MLSSLCQFGSRTLLSTFCLLVTRSQPQCAQVKVQTKQTHCTMPDASSTDLLQLEETARMALQPVLAAQAPPTESSTSLSENQFEREREPTRLSENETEPKKAKVETPVGVYVHANLPQVISRSAEDSHGAKDQSQLVKSDKNDKSASRDSSRSSRRPPAGTGTACRRP